LNNIFLTATYLHSPYRLDEDISLFFIFVLYQIDLIFRWEAGYRKSDS
jgi:hypothetical protein